MEAIIQACGKQYPVKKGQKLVIDRLDAEVGTEINFAVLALLGEKPQIGQPVVNGAQVLAKIVGHKRGDKTIVRTYKRRKGFHKKRGHRQDLTEIEVTEIKL